MAIHRSIKTSLRGVLNKTLEDSVQIALKLAALRIVKVVVAHTFLDCFGRKNSDDEEKQDDVE